MTCGIWGCILFKLKEYPFALPKKNSGRDVVVASSISFAAALWAPAHSFRCSSSSHRKRCAYFAAGALYFPPDDPLETPKGRGPRAPSFGIPPLGWVGEGADAGDGGLALRGTSVGR